MGDLAIVGVAVLGHPDPETPSGLRFRIGINSTAPTAYRVPSVESFLSQNPSNEDIFSRAAEMAMEISAPIEDVRATARYQKLMVRNLTCNALQEVSDSLG
jgi:CO/xanthine dehydrogenase FAD-binding subunit